LPLAGLPKDRAAEVAARPLATGEEDFLEAMAQKDPESRIKEPRSSG